MALNPRWTSSNAAKESFKKVIMNFQERFLLSDRFTTGNSAYVQSLLQRLDVNWKGYSKNHAEFQQLIDNMNDDTVVLDDSFETELEDVSKVYEEAKLLVDARLAQIRKSTEVHQPKPEEILIGEFSGKYHEYTLFRAAVRARVLGTTFPPHIKIDIITKALKGEAKRLIGTIQAQNELEVDRIWTTLETTYYNPYMLKRSHLGQILDLPNLSSVSVTGYRRTIDTTKQSLYALSQLDLDADGLHPMVLEILLRKIDVETLARWEVNRQGLSKESLKTFFDFLESQIIILTNTSQTASGTRSAPAGQPSTHHSEKIHRSASEARERGNARGFSHADKPNAKRFKSTNSQGSSATRDSLPPVPQECIMKCKNKNPHYLWYCKQFRALNLTDRVKTIERNNLCKRCVTEQHSMENCNAKKCPDCSDVHNIILCPKFMVVAKTNTTRIYRGYAKKEKSDDKK